MAKVIASVIVTIQHEGILEQSKMKVYIYKDREHTAISIRKPLFMADLQLFEPTSEYLEVPRNFCKGLRLNECREVTGVVIGEKQKIVSD